ncbi:MAG: PEGA domain-containing protein [Myxococcales bacterium]|nr:PEGA domain-containing protein [Myxococcales bacterium]
MLGLTDAHLGRCADAVQELETFLKLLKAQDDPRIPEAIVARDRCRAELLPRFGTLVVESTPTGAEVRLDPEAPLRDRASGTKGGGPAGVTPFRDEKVTPGEHRVALRQVGFAPLERAVTVRAGETVRLDLPLTPLPSPTVETPPEASQAQPEGKPPGLVLLPAAPAAAPRRTWLWALIGVGAAGAVAAGITLAILFGGRAEPALPAVVFP